jgi:hypothetical protein
MDKFEILVETLVAKTPVEQQAEARAVIVVIADLARDFEQFCADVDRIATAAEKIAEKLNV